MRADRARTPAVTDTSIQRILAKMDSVDLGEDRHVRNRLRLACGGYCKDMVRKPDTLLSLASYLREVRPLPACTSGVMGKPDEVEATLEQRATTMFEVLSNFISPSDARVKLCVQTMDPIVATHLQCYVCACVAGGHSVQMCPDVVSPFGMAGGVGIEVGEIMDQRVDRLAALFAADATCTSPTVTP